MLSLVNKRKAAALFCLGICCIITTADVKQKARSSDVEGRRLIIRSGTLFTKDGVPINLSGFDSEIQSDKSAPGSATGPKQIRDVIVHSGSAFIRAQDLGKLIQTHVHNDKLTDLAVETRGDQMKISGHVKKLIPVHFEIQGPVSLNQNGLIDLHESQMKVDKLPKGLSEALGMDPSKLAGKDPSGGLQVTKQDILMDPSALWGMSVQGKVTQVKVVNNGLMLVYGEVQKTAEKTAQTRVPERLHPRPKSSQHPPHS